MLKIIFSCFVVFIFIVVTPRTANATSIGERLKGRILLEVEAQGQAWYVNPVDLKRYSLGRPNDAFLLMRQMGLGVSNYDFDSWGSIGGTTAPARLSGRILIKVEDRGKAYYISPLNQEAYNLGRPTDAFALMRRLGLGVRTTDLEKIPIAEQVTVIRTSVVPTSLHPNTVAPTNPPNNVAPTVPTPTMTADAFRVTSIDKSVRKETQYDGRVANILNVTILFRGHGRQRIGSEGRIFVTLDVETVDEQGGRPSFFNETNLISMDRSFPYTLETASFVPSATSIGSLPHTYTTTFTLHDNIGNQTTSETITFRFE